MPCPPRQSLPYGPLHTYTGFTAPGRTETSRIDFVMLASEILPGDDESTLRGREAGRGGWEATQYACIDNFVEQDIDGWEGRWSDHRAVRVTVGRKSEHSGCSNDTK